MSDGRTGRRMSGRLAVRRNGGVSRKAQDIDIWNRGMKTKKQTRRQRQVYRSRTDQGRIGKGRRKRRFLWNCKLLCTEPSEQIDESESIEADLMKLNASEEEE